MRRSTAEPTSLRLLLASWRARRLPGAQCYVLILPVQTTVTGCSREFYARLRGERASLQGPANRLQGSTEGQPSSSST